VVISSNAKIIVAHLCKKKFKVAALGKFNLQGTSKGDTLINTGGMEVALVSTVFFLMLTTGGRGSPPGHFIKYQSLNS
jgi:hypothetical protein